MLLLTAAVAFGAAVAVGRRFSSLPRAEWPWWAAVAHAAASGAAAASLGRYTDRRRIRKT